MPQEYKMLFKGKHSGKLFVLYWDEDLSSFIQKHPDFSKTFEMLAYVESNRFNRKEI